METPSVDPKDTPLERLKRCQDFHQLERIAHALWRLPTGNAALMVGSGFSKNAVPAKLNPRPMKNWTELTETLRARLPNSRLIDGGMTALRVPSVFESEFSPSGLISELENAIPDEDWVGGALHKRLLNLPWTDIFTTNWDTLLERTDSKRAYELVRTEERLSRAVRPRIVKLHGSFPDIQPWVITEEHFRRYPNDRPAFVNTFRQCLLENVVCLIGFSGDDPNFSNWLGWVQDCLKGHSPGVFLIDMNLGPSDRRYLTERGVTPVDLSDVFDSYGDAFDAVFELLGTDRGGLTPTRVWPGLSEEKVGGKTLTELKHTYPGWLVPPMSIVTEVSEGLAQALVESVEIDEVRGETIVWAANLTGKILPAELLDCLSQQKEWRSARAGLLDYFLLRFDPANARTLLDVATALQSAKIEILEGNLKAAKTRLNTVEEGELSGSQRLIFGSCLAEVGEVTRAIQVLRKISDEEVSKVSHFTDSIQAWALFLATQIERAHSLEPVSEEVLARFGVFARTSNDPYRLIQEQETEISRPKRLSGVQSMWSHLPSGPRQSLSFALGNTIARSFPLSYLGQAHIPIGISVSWLNETIRSLFFLIPENPTLLSAIHRDGSGAILDEWAGLNHLAAMPSDWRTNLLSRSKNVLEFAAGENDMSLLSTHLTLATRIVRIAADEDIPAFLRIVSVALELPQVTVQTAAEELCVACLAGRTRRVWIENLSEIAKFPLSKSPNWFEPFSLLDGELTEIPEGPLESIRDALEPLKRNGTEHATRRLALAFAHIPDLRPFLQEYLRSQEVQLRQNPELLPHFFNLLGLPANTSLEQALVELKDEMDASKADSVSSSMWRRIDGLYEMYSPTYCSQESAKLLIELVGEVATRTFRVGVFGPFLQMSPPRPDVWQHFLSLLLRDFPSLDAEIMMVVASLQRAGIPTTSVDLQLGKQNAVVELIAAISGTKDARLAAHFYLAKIKDLSTPAVVQIAQEILENVTKSDPFHVFDMLSLLTGGSSAVLLKCIVENPDLLDTTITSIGLLDERTRLDLDTVYDRRNRHLKGSEDARPNLRWLLSVWVARLASMEGLISDARFEPVRNRWLAIGSDPQELPEVREPWLQ